MMVNRYGFIFKESSKNLYLIKFNKKHKPIHISNTNTLPVLCVLAQAEILPSLDKHKMIHLISKFGAALSHVPPSLKKKNPYKGPSPSFFNPFTSILYSLYLSPLEQYNISYTEARPAEEED